MAAKCHKAKKEEWELKVETRQQLPCPACGKELVNKSGLASHQVIPV